ncbi:glycosyltransferase [Ferviditalea candida]|uniref:Glycosyltransferase n=1 Tax=Ferviditalea candida TaxID=3108399 RepID=A0ABU5ZKI9_9BACL|nr:glycosyltransferase [Paenibacillaceae bacterium T2]
MLVSVCMIVRNEEVNLGRALESIPAAYEKIIVDTGSTDDTVEIALQYGAKVEHFRWIQDFAAARNYSISLANGTYILILDADEILASDTEQQVEHFIALHPDQAGTVNIENEVGIEIHKHRMVRFFPNHQAYAFHGIVHESLYYRGTPADFKSTNITVHHFGYQEELYVKGEKAKRYFELYRQHLNRHPDDGYMLYQLGKLHYSLGELQNAVEAFGRCLEVNEQNNLYYPAMLVNFGYVLKEMGEYQLAEELLASMMDRYPTYPDLPFLMGLLAMDTGKIQSIAHYFQRALQIGETPKYSSVAGVGSFKAAYNLGVYYEVTGNRSKAIEYYQKSASYKYPPALERLTKVKDLI